MNSKKILIIDDDMTALDLVDMLFERHGFNVLRHTDGSWVVEHIQELSPDLILIDLMMPKMSGQECIQRLRELGVDIPIVAFTAAHDAELHSTAMTNGANLVLTKPCRSEILIGAVKRLLD